ncbi:MAG: helix-turn-helix domain-containing protein [Lentisphaerae bacterium]|nr:helix-turn-helix domain-containing protein [Lentisphaerota bacterium]MBT4819899.1 helix-turn-helix domain-containing protein [Lentisphaerota bacterium]MBT5608180.1 helix-turn-helix domain-containing protein [Lentisphaerota bacterium]MBT7058931.1 helix-turn-helix domain-containing protein [Lentisphaerota bacterium]MBT7842838.1 helix-turn-helix domain-containing protein [Lentisphaerota bacterium]
MDRIRIIAEEVLSWVSLLPEAPVRYAKEDRLPVNTAPGSLLEFGFHRAGSETLIEVGELRAWSVPNTLVVLNAHFGNRGTPRTNWAYWCVSLDPRVDFPHPEWLVEPLLLTAPVRHPARLTAQYEAVARQYAWEAGAHRYRMKAELLSLLAEVRESVAGESDMSLRSSACEAVLALVEERLEDPSLALPDVARAASLSVAQLCRVFQGEMGTSPMKFVTAKRIEHACDLLQRTALRVSEISSRVGFRDPLHFSRVFRRTIGVSPTRFRRGEGR